ncbi:hypothetical protein RIF29_40411 [Crotalaria pallida]|uniref:Uncharacterized protein n=1 Tax=Crotalaria pallida TaxID=3830 RepID=A0AAN9HQL9_CROPI
MGRQPRKSDANDLKWMIGQRLVEIEQKKARDQFQPGFVLGANNNNGAGEALNMQQNAVAPMMGHDEGLMLLTNNVNDNAAAAAAMHNQDWSMDSLPAANNNGGGNQMFSYGNYHLPYGYVGGPSSSNA